MATHGDVPSQRSWPTAERGLAVSSDAAVDEAGCGRAWIATDTAGPTSQAQQNAAGGYGLWQRPAWRFFTTL